MPRISYCLETTVEPVLSSTVLSGRPVSPEFVSPLSGIYTSIERSWSPLNES